MLARMRGGKLSNCQKAASADRPSIRSCHALDTVRRSRARTGWPALTVDQSAEPMEGCRMPRCGVSPRASAGLSRDAAAPVPHWPAACGASRPGPRLKAVTHPWLGDQISRPAGFRFELAPKLGHEYPQVARIGVVRRPSQIGQQSARPHEPARFTHERRQQMPLGRREMDALAVGPGGGGGREVDRDVSELDTALRRPQAPLGELLRAPGLAAPAC